MDSGEEQQEKKQDENPAKVLLGLSENKKNGAPKRPRTREITSRFMGPTVSSSSSCVTAPISSSAAKCSSPRRSRSPDIQPKRPQPGTRRQPSPYPTDFRAPPSEGHRRPGPEALRSLSVSMQDEKFNSDHPLKPTSGDSGHRAEGTPEKKRSVISLFRENNGDQSENAKPLDNLLPRPRVGKAQVHPMSRSVNNNMEKAIRAGQGRSRTPKPNPCPTSRSVSGAIGDSVMTSCAPRTIPLDGKGRGTKGSGMQVEDPDLIRLSPPQEPKLEGVDINTGTGEMTSSPESFTSECSSQAKNPLRRSQEGGVHGFIVPARFLQDVNSRSRGSSEVRHSMPEAELSSSTSVRVRGGGRLSKSSTQALPPHPNPSHTLPQQSISPVKIIPGSSSPSRCLPSPTRSRVQAPLPPTTSSQNVRSSVAGSVINFGADAKKGKKGTNQIEDAHLLRILYNRHLQWRFVNAKAEAAMNAQKVAAEKMLCNMCMSTSELRDSVTMKCIELQKALRENKLRSVLSGQKAYLEDWALLEQDHLSFLSEAIKNLEAATLRLPIIDGVKANLPEVKEAVNSAVHVMYAMSSSVCKMLPKVEGTSTLVSELAAVAAQERALLDECGELLGTAGALQVEEASLKAHLIQLKQYKCRDVG